MTESVGTIMAESLEKVAAEIRKNTLKEVWSECEKINDSDYGQGSYFPTLRAWLRSKLDETKP